MIGLIDYNFLLQKRGLPPPSIDAMKMSSYLKQHENEEIILLTNLNQIESCSKAYFFSDLEIERLPKELFSKYNSLELYGKYLNVLPQIIEHMIPDITLYNQIVQEKVAEKTTTINRALQFLDSFYFKIWGNQGERLPMPPSYSRKRFYLYDEDILGKDECWDILNDIENRAPSAIYTIQPIQCHTITQFFKLREDYEKVSRGNKIILDFFIPPHQIDTYFSKYKLKLLGEITKNSEVYIYLGKNYTNNKAYNESFYLKNLYYTINLFFSYWSRNIPIKIENYYLEKEINPYKDVYNAFRMWANNSENDIPLKITFCSKKLEKSIEEISKKYPIFLHLIEQSKNSLINTRGIWRYE